MIKLQLLLRHPRSDIALDPALRARLEQQGFQITGSGRASVSATVSEADFARLFGTPPAVHAGFAPDPLHTPALAVPAALDADISLITVAPHHRATNQSPRGRHAAI